ncbi:MAG: HAD family phosphatase [Ignavibacteria bacterium]|nr:HAD family phosphatase [Ignavibacteria bacterium]
MSVIKNIIFDLGGVLLNIDYQKPIDSFKELGINNIESVFNQFVQNDISIEYEKGFITDKDFRNHLRAYSNIILTDDWIDKAWNSILLDFPNERFDMLRKLKSNYALYLLSNTNSLHQQGFNKILSKQIHPLQLENFFIKAYYSHKIGLRKPDDAIFNFVLNDAAILPNETLYIDDSIQHIETANRLNFITHHLKKDEEIITVINKIISKA